MRTVYRYESKDGKIFDSEKECYIYESRASPEIVAIADTLRQFSMSINGYDTTAEYASALHAAKVLDSYFDIKPKN